MTRTPICVLFVLAACGTPSHVGEAPDVLAQLGTCPAEHHAEDSDERCQNGLDDDCNGYYDCRDWACSAKNGVTACCGGGIEGDDASCHNHWDDDCDGYVDCFDFSCLATNGVTACCGDGGPENSDVACTNGIDDDCNGYVDCKDFACSKNKDVSACCEPAPETCANDLDDDCDGDVDCADDECLDDAACKPACVPIGPEDDDARCSNGRDDDCDGYFDCIDFGCSKNPDVAVCRSGGTAGECDPCDSGADCASGACVSYSSAPAPQPKFCSNRCEDDGDCGPRLESCSETGYCGATSATVDRRCDDDGRGFTVRDPCGYIIRQVACAAGESCTSAGDQVRCTPPCVGLLGSCDEGGTSTCCDGLQGLNTLPAPAINCICFKDDGQSCTRDEECAPDLSECQNGTCTTCFRSCAGGAPCCDGMECAEWGSCAYSCDPSSCHAFCLPGYGCCDQHCAGVSCVTDHCSFE